MSNSEENRRESRKRHRSNDDQDMDYNQDEQGVDVGVTCQTPTIAQVTGLSGLRYYLGVPYSPSTTLVSEFPGHHFHLEPSIRVILAMNAWKTNQDVSLFGSYSYFDVEPTQPPIPLTDFEGKFMAAMKTVKQDAKGFQLFQEKTLDLDHYLKSGEIQAKRGKPNKLLPTRMSKPVETSVAKSGNGKEERPGTSTSGTAKETVEKDEGGAASAPLNMKTEEDNLILSYSVELGSRLKLENTSAQERATTTRKSEDPKKTSIKISTYKN